VSGRRSSHGRTLLGACCESSSAAAVARNSLPPVRFLFTTLQHRESDFYGRVGAILAQRGNDVEHVTFSRRAAAVLRRRGFTTHCLPELMASLGPLDLEHEAGRIERTYEMPSLRDVYRTDPPCEGRTEAWCVERTVRHFLALERIVDEGNPQVIVPEVGSETLRTAAHLIGVQRGIPVLFLLYTIFPQPLRLYRDTLHAPIVPPAEVRQPTAAEREEVEGFIADFTERATPIRAYREPGVTPGKLSELARHLAVRALYDRDNDYLRPGYFVTNYVRKQVRRSVAERLYEPLEARSRPFVYFPLHVTDDYKIRRVVPHCVHQDAIVEQVADALPQGYDLVLKEHPLSIGWNPLGMLRRLSAIDNVRLVHPYTSSHELISRSHAVAVIGSTVGLEALLYAKPVMTIGQPFYSGYAITLDVDSFRELREAVPALLGFRPDRDRIIAFLRAAMQRCRPGKPVLVDHSDENALALASSLDAAGREAASDPVPRVGAGLSGLRR
jgi:Capsule polysaccharide biosynthesis protein